MAETIQDACTPIGAKKWHWYNVRRDLVEQGGLEDKEVMINPLSVNSHGCGGEHRGNPFYITWALDAFLLVTAKKDDPALVDAFAKVVGYQPFAKYKEPNSGLVTTEWDKIDPNGRYQDLQKEDKLELTYLFSTFEIPAVQLVGATPPDGASPPVALRS